MPQSGRQIDSRPASRRKTRSLLHAFSTPFLLVLVVVLLAACAGVNDSGTSEEYIETQAAGQPDEQPGHGEDDIPDEPGDEGTPGTDGDGGDLAATGEELSVSAGCVGCHSIDGSTQVGPTWQDLYGSEVPLEDGSTVTADDDYIAQSIREPGSQIHEGFQNIMPNTYSDWTDEQVNAIIAYIQTLE